MINRRQAIKCVAGLTVAAVGCRLWQAREELCFYVAGARYFRRQMVKAGDVVVLEPAHVVGETACRVRTREGNPLGYVPKKLLLAVRGKRHARVEAVALDGVPWRWYRIVVD